MIIPLTLAYFIAAGWLASTFGLVASSDPKETIGIQPTDPGLLDQFLWIFQQIGNFLKLATFQVDGIYYIANLCLLLVGAFLVWKCLRLVRGGG